MATGAIDPILPRERGQAARERQVLRVGVLGRLEDPRQAGELLAPEDGPQTLQAQAAPAPVPVVLAVRAQRRARVVEVEGADRERAQRAVRAGQEAQRALGAGEVVARGPRVRGVQAHAQGETLGTQGLAEARELLESSSQAPAPARDVLEQELAPEARLAGGAAHGVGEEA